MIASEPKRGWLIALAAVAASLAVLYGMIPYTIGYGSSPITLFQMLWALWNESGDWQHGMLVLPIAGWLIYRQRAALARIPVAGNNAGLGVIVIALLFYYAGFKADVQYIGYASFQLLLAGLVIYLLGWRFFRAVLFPWAFLAFMWPLLFLDNLVAFPLRMAMSEIAYRFLDLVGLDVVKQGSAVVSAADFSRGIEQGARFAVDIDDPCSGIRSLFALVMITCIYAYLTMPRGWRQWALFLSAVPLAVFGNFCRILMLVFGTIGFGAEFAIGSPDKPSTYHMAAGFLVFAVALLGMTALARLLKKIASPPPSHA